MFLDPFQPLPEFLRAEDLVKLGLYPTTNALYFARLRGKSPNFVKIGRKILYPKQAVIKFLECRLQSGEKRKDHQQ